MTRSLWHILWMLLRLASVVNRSETQALELPPQNYKMLVTVANSED